MFSKYLDMSKYLTNNQYEIYKVMLNDKYAKLDSVETVDKPKFRVANGQVILIEADHVPSRFTTPQDYVQSVWDITDDYQLLPIPNCMLRGMLDLKEGKFSEVNKLIPENQDNEKVRLKKENVPTHMHHSSVTTGANFPTTIGKSTSGVYCTNGGTVYDMFYNDSMDVGLSKNELDGTIDKFTVDGFGRNDSTSDDPSMSHDNMPKYHAFYGFVVQKKT